MQRRITLEALKNLDQTLLPTFLWDFYLDYSRETENEHWARTGQRRNCAELREFDLSLPCGIRLVHSLIRFDGDILNGGISQYFGNHDPDQVMEDLQALRTIGATESIEIMERAISIYREHGWPDAPNEKGRGWRPWEDVDLGHVDHLRCNDDASHRDFGILNTYLVTHLEQCVFL